MSAAITISRLAIARGMVTARAGGARGRHSVTIRVASLSKGAWDRIVAALAADPNVMAGVLEGELPEELVAAASPSPLEPLPSQVRAECGCSRWGARCAHVRAVWRAAQAEVRRVPSLALTLRGRDAFQLSGEAAALARLAKLWARGRDMGVHPSAAYARAGNRPPLPQIQIPTVTARPEYELEPGFLPHHQLEEQAADAAARALQILQGTGDGGLTLDRESDLARIGAMLASPWDVDSLAWRSGLRPFRLRKLVSNWRAAHEIGLPIPPPADSNPSRRREPVTAIVAVQKPTQLTLWGNDQ